MNRSISQKFQPSEDILLISGSIVDVMINFRNITKQATPVLFRANISEYAKLSGKVSGFSNLQSNWDSYDAEVISSLAIKTAKKTLAHLNINGLLTSQIEINVFPMRDGGIQFEFDGENICAELEINPHGDSIFILFDDDGNMIDKWQLFELSELSIILEDAQYA
ncbi:MAG: hypothetical protein RBR28_11875 [Lentimicrobium sp.]|jgi:hypothetical protein|nr:hypothetical protein [Lentimicrobium sp.]